MKTIDLTWSNHGGHNRVYVIDPDATSVAAIAKAGRRLIDAHKAFREIDRERTAAQGDPQRLAAEASVAAQDAGRDGKPVKPKELRKKVAAAIEHLADVELEWEAASSSLHTRRREYLDALAHHAPALAAEADNSIEAALMSLAGAAATARRAEAQLSSALAVRDAVSTVQEGGDFVPKAPRAKSGGMGGAPGPYVGIALENITTAIGYGSEIRDELQAREKAEATRARMEAEADEAPDLDEDEDDDGE